MPLIQPFRALRPAPGRAAEVLAPPYDVLSSAEARERANGKPWSFLHISKPEIDLDPAIDLHDPAVYAKAAENLGGMIARGVLVRDDAPAYYAYRLTRRGPQPDRPRRVASVADYGTNRIRKHELTTPVKEDDRVRQIEAINAQTGPVMMAYPRGARRSTRMLADARARARPRSTSPPTTASATSSGRSRDAGDDRRAHRAPSTPCPPLYIADGHHRSAAAARVARARAATARSHALLPRRCSFPTTR